MAHRLPAAHLARRITDREPLLGFSVGPPIRHVVPVKLIPQMRQQSRKSVLPLLVLALDYQGLIE